MNSGYAIASVGLSPNPDLLAVKIQDNHEPLIDLRYQGDIAYGSSPEVPNNLEYTKLRKTVYEKLKQAQSLLPAGLYFCLYEGYRTLQLQKMLFDNRFAKLAQQHPEWSHNQIFAETTRLIAPTVNQDGSANIPPHSTGGAIDVYLIDDKGEYLDMGIHPKDWLEDDDGSLSLTLSTAISIEAQEHRKIMSVALAAVDFVNYPAEYWHWTYGERYWAYRKQASHAFYGSL